MSLMEAFTFVAANARFMSYGMYPRSEYSVGHVIIKNTVH